MANRTTNVDVLTIMNSSLTGTQVDGFITIANRMVTDNLAGESSFGDDELAEIEKWLTAHLISITKERQVRAETVGDVRVEFTGKFGDGLKMTTYGQMVLVLDSSGILASMGKQKASTYAVTSFK